MSTSTSAIDNAEILITPPNETATETPMVAFIPKSIELIETQLTRKINTKPA
jgi:hypothetical protein